MARKKDVSSEKTSNPVKAPSSKATAAANKPAAASKVKKDTANSVTTISSEERYKMIAQTAYFRAEARGFSGGDPQEDWVLAEKEVDRQLKQLR
jgi:Protein of unknown function (DUF2934)